jgi:hypothetical protein
MVESDPRQASTIARRLIKLTLNELPSEHACGSCGVNLIRSVDLGRGQVWRVVVRQWRIVPVLARTDTWEEHCHE